MFAPGTADILPSGEPTLDRVAQNLILLGIQTYKVDVEGHTDDDPISTAKFPSNWELSAARAAAVARFLISRGVDPERITVIGYGDTRPKRRQPRHQRGADPGKHGRQPPGRGANRTLAFRRRREARRGTQRTNFGMGQSFQSG